MKIKIKDRTTSTVLKEFDLTNEEEAYAYATEMEEMGLDVEIISPTVTQSLGGALGVNSTEMQKMEDSIKHEIEEHDVTDSCCFKDTDKSKLH